MFQVRDEDFRASAGEKGVVDFDGVLDHGDVGAEVLAEGREESGVGFRRVERFSGGADNTDGAEREQDRDRGGVAINFLREDAAERIVAQASGGQDDRRERS